MASSIKAHEIVADLAHDRKTVLLGGMAVILHGLSRNTKDIDIWLDPAPDVEAWADSLQVLLQKRPYLQFLQIGSIAGTWNSISSADLSTVGKEDRLIRISGADRPIDVFFIPNELEATDFEAIWNRAKPLNDGVRLIEEIDLIVTKQGTERPHDETDIRFLHDKVETSYRSRLGTCSATEAAALFERFVTPEIAAFAFRESKDSEVKFLSWNLLQEMRDAGDPFASELMEEIRASQQDQGPAK